MLSLPETKTGSLDGTTQDKKETYSVGDFKYPPPDQKTPEIGVAGGRFHVKIHDARASHNNNEMSGNEVD